MRQLITLVCFLGLFSSCNSNWEYKTVEVKSGAEDDFSLPKFKISDEDLNLFGKDGWELIDVIEITETTHPNFGNAEYVTGIRENTRTKSINYVFKRRKY